MDLYLKLKPTLNLFSLSFVVAVRILFIFSFILRGVQVVLLKTLFSQLTLHFNAFGDLTDRIADRF